MPMRRRRSVRRAGRVFSQAATLTHGVRDNTNHDAAWPSSEHVHAATPPCRLKRRSSANGTWAPSTPGQESITG